MKINKKVTIFITAFILLIGYINVPTASGAEYDELNKLIRELSDYLNTRLPAKSKVVFLNFQSDYPMFSEYILSNLTENAVNDGLFTVVDRQQLSDIRSELNFQWSGEVSDASAQKIGQMFGAQSIVSGTVNKIENELRIKVRAISVQNAVVQGESTQKIDIRNSFVAKMTTIPAANEAKEKKKREDLVKRQIEKIKFLSTSGFAFGGWFGFYHEYGKNNFPYGGDIEFRIYEYFGLQSGIEIFKDFDKPNFEVDPLDDPIVTQTILQIPVLARITIPIFNLFYLSAYGGLGINLFPFDKNDAIIQSHSPYSYIIGGEFGIFFLQQDTVKFFVGYQYNRDLSDTEYSYRGTNFSYLGKRAMITFGLRCFLPFSR